MRIGKKKLSSFALKLTLSCVSISLLFTLGAPMGNLPVVNPNLEGITYSNHPYRPGFNSDTAYFQISQSEIARQMAMGLKSINSMIADYNNDGEHGKHVYTQKVLGSDFRVYLKFENAYSSTAGTISKAVVGINFDDDMKINIVNQGKVVHSYHVPTDLYVNRFKEWSSKAKVDYPLEVCIYLPNIIVSLPENVKPAEYGKQIDYIRIGTFKAENPKLCSKFKISMGDGKSINNMNLTNSKVVLTRIGSPVLEANFTHSGFHRQLSALGKLAKGVSILTGGASDLLITLFTLRLDSVLRIASSTANFVLSKTSDKLENGIAFLALGKSGYLNKIEDLMDNHVASLNTMIASQLTLFTQMCNSQPSAVRPLCLGMLQQMTLDPRFFNANTRTTCSASYYSHDYLLSNSAGDWGKKWRDNGFAGQQWFNDDEEYGCRHSIGFKLPSGFGTKQKTFWRCAFAEVNELVNSSFEGSYSSAESSATPVGLRGSGTTRLFQNIQTNCGLPF